MGVHGINPQGISDVSFINKQSAISQSHTHINDKTSSAVAAKSLENYTIAIVAEQESAKNTIMDILKQNANIFQSNASLAQCKQMINMAYAANQKACIVIMNTWSMEQMEDFIDKYTTLPEAMLGKLFSVGLSPDILPNDIKQSKAFLHVAVVNNPERLTNEILSKLDIQTSRLCISQLDKDDIKKLYQYNLPLMYLPINTLTDGSLLQRNSNEYLQPMFMHIIKNIKSRQASIAG